MIYADHDENDVGAEAAKTLARNLRERFFSVKILMPSKPGFDYNDILVELRAADALERFGTAH